MKFTKLMSAGVVSAMMIMASNAMAASITYTGMQTIDGGTVNYSFTTDGTIGAINNENLLDFNFDIAKSGAMISISRSSSGRFNFYDDGFFNTTPTTLTLTGFGSSDAFEASTDETIVRLANNLGGNLRVFSPILNGGVVGIGAPLATAGSVSAVPEPATWAMMIGGFGGIGGMLRRRRSGAMVAVAA